MKYRIKQSFGINLLELREGEIISPIDFFTRLHNLDLTPYIDYFEPIDIYFLRRYSPIFSKIDGLREDQFTSLQPIKELNQNMRSLLAAREAEDVPAFDAAIERIEKILGDTEERTGKKTHARRIKKTVHDEKVKKDLKKALSGRLKK